MLDVLKSVEVVIPFCRSVQIDAARIAEVCSQIGPGDLRLPDWDMPVFCREDPDALAGQILLFNTINFCYWGDPKWQVEYRGRWWDGSMAVLGAIHRAIDEGIPLLDGAFLAQISEVDFAYILRGQGLLHLMAERLAIWREVGATLVAEFGGRLTEVIKAAHHSAPELVCLLVDRFPSFNDFRVMVGKPVCFYKRAQLAAATLYEAFDGRGWGALNDTEALTVFADYKLPQVLRRLDVLVYSPELAAAVDSKTLIPAGDPWEVEIRVATVWAAELMRRALVSRLPQITALHIDYWLWHAGRDQGPGVRPYHRTLTTAY